jgi:hypothetical protein
MSPAGEILGALVSRNASDDNPRSISSAWLASAALRRGRTPRPATRDRPRERFLCQASVTRSTARARAVLAHRATLLLVTA